jgi:hypothetical protein
MTERKQLVYSSFVKIILLLFLLLLVGVDTIDELLINGVDVDD